MPQFTFDLKMFASVSLGGKNIVEARKKVEAAFDRVSIEVDVGGKQLRSTGFRDGLADSLDDAGRSKAGNVPQLRYVFDLMFFGKLTLDADSADTARRLIDAANIQAIVVIDGEQRKVRASVDGEADLLEIDGRDPDYSELQMAM